MIQQRTVRREFALSGVGLHGGEPAHLRVRPAPPDTGLVFRRMDVSGFSVRATGRLVAEVDHATTLLSGRNRIRTVEHLLAALSGMGVDNAFVEVHGEEVPIADGSATPFVARIHAAGIRNQGRPRRFLRLRRTLEVQQGRKWIVAHPADDFRISYTIDFPHPWIGRQSASWRITPEVFQNELAPARTFAFLKDVDALRHAGLARGGSLQNAVVLTEDGVLNPEGLRFRNECIRHKALDCVGDLSLLGFPLLAHVVVEKGGHALHTAMANRILSQPAAWDLVTLGEEAGAALPPATARLRNWAAATA